MASDGEVDGAVPIDDVHVQLQPRPCETDGANVSCRLDHRMVGARRPEPEKDKTSVGGTMALVRGSLADVYNKYTV